MKSIPVYTFDLSVKPENRWAALPKTLKTVGKKVACTAVKDLDQGKQLDAIALALRVLTKGRNPYRGEIKGSAAALGISYRDAIVSNFLYEIGQVGGFGYGTWVDQIVPFAERMDEVRGRIKKTFNSLKGRLMACTAGAAPVEGLGMIHVRSLDWPMEGLGKHSLILHHVNGKAGDFYSVGWPGYSGILSGFKPGKFSATINQASMLCRPNLQWPPAHLLRWVFEHCESYAEALDLLKSSPVCVHAFVLLASPKKAAVVELAPNGNTVVTMKKEPLVIANNYISKKNRRASGDADDDDDDDLGYDRRGCLKNRLQKFRKGTLLQAHKLLQVSPVENGITVQQMVFAHGTQEMLVVGRECSLPVSRAQI